MPDGTVKGSYGFVDATGKKHIVKYTAGKEGFKVEGDVNPDIAAASQAVHPSLETAPQPQPQPQSQPQPQPQLQPQPQFQYQLPSTVAPSYAPQRYNTPVAPAAHASPLTYQPQTYQPPVNQVYSPPYNPTRTSYAGPSASSGQSVYPSSAAYNAPAGSYSAGASSGGLASSASASLPTRAVQPKLSAPVQILSRPPPPVPMYNSQSVQAHPISSASRYAAVRNRIHASASSSQPTYSTQYLAKASPVAERRADHQPAPASTTGRSASSSASPSIDHSDQNGTLGYVSLAMRSFLNRIKA